MVRRHGKKLLEAAETEFGERGFAKASVSSITRRAGVGQGTFYLYFPGKEAVLIELVRHMGRELRRALSARYRWSYAPLGGRAAWSGGVYRL